LGFWWIDDPRKQGWLRRRLWQAAGRQALPERIAKRDLGIGQLADKFAQADPAATKLVLGLLLEIERRAPPEADARPPLEEVDKLVIANFLARVGGSVGSAGERQPCPADGDPVG
jgi:hypothetical protein